MPLLGRYNPAKWGLEGFTEALASAGAAGQIETVLEGRRQDYASQPGFQRDEG